MPDDSDEFPSAALVLDVLRSGREERRAHFDALDQKAGLALGFAGVLVTLSNDIDQPWRAGGVGASIVAAALALWSFWPREYPVVHNARKYLAAPEHRTRLALVDTLHEMDARTDLLSQTKARRLKWSFGALAAAVLLLGIGVNASERGGSDGDQPGRPAAVRTAPSPSSATR